MHQLFYRKLMGFEQFGATRFYPATGVMGEAYLLDVTRLREELPETYRQIFGCPFPPATLTRARLSPDQLAKLANHSSVTTPDTVADTQRQVRVRGHVQRW